MQQPQKKPARQGVQKSNSDKIPASSVPAKSDLNKDAGDILLELHEKLFLTFPHHNEESKKIRKMFLTEFAGYEQRRGIRNGITSSDIENLKAKLENLKQLADSSDSEKVASPLSKESPVNGFRFQFCPPAGNGSGSLISMPKYS